MRLRQVLLGISVSLLATLALVALGPSPHAGANPTPGIKPDITLTPGEEPQFFEYNSVMIGENRTEPPDNCRNNPAFGLGCDALRLKLNLSKKPGAQNFVIMELNWDHIQPPTVVAVVAGVSPAVVPDLDLVLYRTPTISKAPSEVGGQGITSPERLAFIATQSEYDVVVKIDTGFSQGYTLRAFMSDELFERPFESLDEALKAADEVMPAAPFEESFTPPFDGFGVDDGAPEDIGLPPLADANVTTDRQIRNLGFGITEQFGGNAIDLGRGQSREVVAVGKAPSGISLVLALIVIPLAAAAGGTLWLRRRRQALI